MITTVRVDLTWDGKIAKAMREQSEKKIKQTLKDLTAANDIEIIEVNSWDEEDDFDE